MKTFRKGIAANYLKSSDRLHAEKMSNTCKKIINSMRKTISTLLSSNSIYAESNINYLLKEQRQHKFNAIESGKMCKNPNITTY